MRCKKIPALLLLCCIASTILSAQNKTYQIKADSVRIFSNCDTAELILQNRTRGVLNSWLFNKGNGVTEFRKILTRINSCTYLIGGDSLKLDACTAANSGSMAWLLNGNTVGGVKTFGTVDNVDLPFVTGNIEKMRLNTAGNLLVGLTTPVADAGRKLQVNGRAVTFDTHSFGGIEAANFNIMSAVPDATGLGYTGINQALNNGTQFLQGINGGVGASWEFASAFTRAVGRDAYGTYGVVNEFAVMAISQGWRNPNMSSVNGSTLLISPTINNFGTEKWQTIRGVYYNPIVSNLSPTTKHIAFSNETGDNVFNNSSGNTLIGTATGNGNKLQVNGNIWSTGLILPTGAAAGKVLTSDANGSASWQAATGGGGTGTNAWLLNGNTVGSLKSFGTIDNVDLPFITGNTEKMRITSNGNIGIGTGTPQYKLQVEGTSYSKVFTNATEPLGGSSSGALRLRWGGAEGTYIDFYNQGNALRRGFIATPADSRRLYIYDALGFTFGNTLNVTIGTENAMFDNAKLGIANPVGSTVNAVSIGRDDPSTPKYDWVVKSTGNTVIGSNMDAGYKLDVNGSFRASGIAYPTTNGINGQVLTTDGSGVASWQAATGGSGSNLSWLLNGNTVGSAKTFGTIDNFDLPFITNNTERMRIGSNGSVGIATTSPVAKVDIVTGIGDGTINEANTFRLRSNATANNAMTMQFGVNNAGIGGANQGYGYIQAAYWGGSVNNPIRLNPQGGGVTVGTTGLSYQWGLLVRDKIVAEAPLQQGNTIAGTFGFSAGSTYANYNALQASIQGIFDKPQVSNGMGMVFNTSNASNTVENGVERMRISSDGYVGIGVAAPLASLHIKGAGTTSATTSLLVTNSQNNKIISVSDDQVLDIRPNRLNPQASLKSRAIDTDGRFAFDISDGSNGAYQLFSIFAGRVGFGQNNASPDYATHSALRVAEGRTYIDMLTVAPTADIYGPYGIRGLDITRNSITTTLPSFPMGSTDNRDDLSITGNNILLKTGFNANTAIFINNQANTGIGTSSPTARLHTLGTVRFESLPTGTGDPLVIDAAGNVARGGGTPSDFNLKENILSSQFNSNKLLGLVIKDFNYKSDKNKTRYTGLIAQELKKVIPELVLGTEGSYSIDYVKMVPYLLKAVQDQQAFMQAQQKEIDLLKQQLTTAGDAIKPDILARVQKQLQQQQEEIKLLKEQIKNK